MLGTPMDTNFAYGANPSEFRSVYREHHDLTLRSTRLFAQQAIPRLRHLWDDYTDYWSPTPIAAYQPKPTTEPQLAGVNRWLN